MNPLKSLWSKLNPRSALDVRPSAPRAGALPNGLQNAPLDVPFNQMPADTLERFITPAAQVRWLGPGVAWFSPQRVEQIFRQALSGDLQSQWEMFDLMEATSPNISKNLNQLKDGVAAANLCVQPFKLKDQEASAEAKRRAAFVEECLWSMNPAPEADENDFEDTLRDLMDARGKGHSVLEIAWEVRAISAGQAIAPRCTRWVHPAWYGYEFGPGDANLKLKSGPYSEYMSTVTAGPLAYAPFPANKFIIGICKNKTGHPLGSALLHTLGFAWAGANFSNEWFLNLAQVFGLPIRWATYDPNMTPGDQTTLYNMLAQMGSSAFGMFPDGTHFELKEGMKNAGEAPQKVFMDWFEKLCDLLILRQTLTSDVSAAGGSRAQGEVHERILGKVEMQCCKWTCKTLQPLIKSIMLFNFGDLRECPFLAPPVAEEDESEELCANLSVLAQAGLEPTDEALPELSTRIGFDIQRRPAADPAAVPAAKLDDNDDQDDASPADLQAKDAGGQPISNAKINAIVFRKTQAVAVALRENFADTQKIINDSKSPAECEAKLRAYFADWRPTQIVRALQPALKQCAAAGLQEGRGAANGTELSPANQT